MQGHRRSDFRKAAAARVGWLLLFAVIVGAALLLISPRRNQPAAPTDDFTRQMNSGKNYLDKGEATRAIAPFSEAVKLEPSSADARLNLANAHLRADQPKEAVEHSLEAIKFDPRSAAGYYVAGSAYLRLRQFDQALKYLQQAHDIDFGDPVAAVSFQLGRTHLELGHLEDAINSFEETIQLDPNHPSAHYLLSQALIRAGRQAEAAEALAKHQTILAARTNAPPAVLSTYEQCRYTQARAPFTLEQPSPAGIPVTFQDATAAAFGPAAAGIRAPLALLDLGRRGRNDLFAAEDTNGFRIFINSNGTFRASDTVLPALPGFRHGQCLVGDLQNDRAEDVLVLGDAGIQVFKLATNGMAMDMTQFSGLTGFPAAQGALVDLDFTGKLDLFAASTNGSAVRLYRNLGNFTFQEITQTSGIPAVLSGVSDLAVDDWNNDDLMDLFLAQSNGPPVVLLKQRGGPLQTTNLFQRGGSALTLGDLNNDLQNDLVTASSDQIECVFGGPPRPSLFIPLSQFAVRSLNLIDYDNDGWLDVVAVGRGLKVWRNRGQKGFEEVTRSLGLDKIGPEEIETLVAADFNNDCATDLLFAKSGGGIKLFLNRGGEKNNQLKVFLLGNRSNASGLGIRLEARAGNWRTARTVHSLPIEIGVGKVRNIESLTARWFDLAIDSSDVAVECQNPITLVELTLPTGSCPYLYAWDGTSYRFVTDLLGAAPLGLRLTDHQFIDSDSEELVWLGNEKMFPPRDGRYSVQITEELREVLYLDEAKLLVVDHPAGTRAVPTSKLRPGKPFPPHEVMLVDRPHQLKQALRNEREDVTADLAETDGHYVSPASPRLPQLRGLAEPYTVTLDFGPLSAGEPLVLVMTGWLRFGGGMANVGASHHPDLPFPFPTLEAEDAQHHWKPLDVVVGAPAGKTKTIAVDLKLPFPARRLRLRTAFEIHWDQIGLWEKPPGQRVSPIVLRPSTTDLHWRGFSRFANEPWSVPLTPVYSQVSANPNWRIAVSGWCTRYGPVHELIAARDDAFVLLNGGDELTLNFEAALPAKPAGYVRDFFLQTAGWDKDADFHVEQGTTVEPLPFRGMDDQMYGREPRPELPADELMRKYNTRWVGPLTLTRRGR